MIDLSNLSLLFSNITSKITVPTEFGSQCAAVETMLRDDVTGLVGSLTNFSIQTASVDFSIESENKQYSSILNKWLETINSSYKGRIPIGINALVTEYLKELWQGSSFPVLKLGKLKRFEGGLMLPTRAFFVDGSSIRAKEKDDGDMTHLLNFDYYLGSKQEKKYLLEGDNVIYARTAGRWFDRYPVPYLIKNGVWHNSEIIKNIKDKQAEILSQIIPYIMHVKKGDATLVKENIKAGYSNEELQKIKDDIKGLVDELKGTSSNLKKDGTPIRVTNFDESLEHLIPNLSNIFQPELTQTAERNILSGLGFIDIVEATSSSRRESILNPKAFIEEIKAGVKGFKAVLQQIMYYVEAQNKDHKKYINSDYNIISSPIETFQSDDFKNQLRLLWERGQVSNQTYCEVVGQVSYQTEVYRREKEIKSGQEVIMYPHQTQNNEKDETPEEVEHREKSPKKDDKNGKPIDNDKLDDPQKYNIGKKELEIAPYQSIKDLPKEVKNKLSPSLSRTFIKVWNDAFDRYGSESKAFRIAWSVIKKISKLDKSGKYIRKENARLTVAIIKKELDKE